MLNKSIFVLLFIGFISSIANAQLTDLFRLEYSFIPKSKSQDQYTRLRALFNYPIKIKESDYLVFGAEYNRVILNLEDTYPFETSGLNTIHIIDFNLGYTFKWNENWRFGFKVNPRIASTLTRSITNDDIFINGGVYFVTDRMDDTSLKHPYRLVLGLTYNATTGLPFPLPFISYTREINEHWEYNLGVPKSSLKYNINNKHVLLSFVGLDGYLAHLQRPTIVNGQEVDHISLSVMVGGAGYQYFFTEHIMGYMYSGYSFRLNNVLRNDNRDEIYKLDDRNAFYLRTGIKYKF